MSVSSPFPGVIEVTSPVEAEVSVVDILGKVVATASVCGKRAFTNLFPGVYVVNNHKVFVR